MPGEEVPARPEVAVGVQGSIIALGKGAKDLLHSNATGEFDGCMQCT